MLLVVGLRGLVIVVILVFCSYILFDKKKVAAVEGRDVGLLHVPSSTRGAARGHAPQTVCTVT